MPELPEVETTRRGLAPWVIDRRVEKVIVRERRLRWPVPRGLARRLAGRRIRGLGRRGKYLLFHIDGGTLIVHLGMSGSLYLVPADTPAGPTEHLDLVLDDGRALRLRDPRRFGAVLWTGADPGRHPRLAGLGPEPLEAAFDGDYVWRHTRGRRTAIKNWLMDAGQVAGVGNIYASEALFRAGIRPGRAAGRLTRAECDRLARTVKAVLREALRAGGTTLRDFLGGDGRPGYFRQRLFVYGRAGAPCRRCATPVRRRRIGQRSSFYCPRCQK